MLARHTLVRASLAALALAALGACTTMQGQKGTLLTAQLSGSQEVPPNTRPATGTAEVRYDRESGMLSYKVTYSGLSGPATGAHIHGPAGPGANAGIVVPFPNTASPITGQTKITPAQAGDLLAGLWYVNIHSAAHPGGEIRGQLTAKR